MEAAIFIVLGAVLGFVGGLIIIWRQRVSQFRANIFLEILPELESTAERFHYVASQTYPPTSNPSYLRDDDWLDPKDTDHLYRCSLLAGRSDTVRARRVRDRWAAMANRMDQDLGTPSNQVYADKDMAAASRQVLVSINEYKFWLEAKFTCPRAPKSVE